MDSLNATVAPQQGSEALQGMFASYKKQKEVKKRLTKEEILARYFNPRKDKEFFRILPTIDNDNTKPLLERLFPVAYFHVIKTGKGGKSFKKVYCPAHNDPKVQAIGKDGQPVFGDNGKPVMMSAPCPLCKKHKTILATQNREILAKTKGKKADEIKKLLTEDEYKIYEQNKKIYADAGKYEAKKYYVVRGVDKGSEKDGVKFWRIKHHFKNQGDYDKIMGVTEDYSLQHGDFTDVETGTDLTILVVDSQIPGSNFFYRSVSSIIPRGPSKLSNDPTIAKQWLDDKTTWRDVFTPAKAPKITPLQYLELAAEGVYERNNSPYWDDSDSNNKKWVFPNHPDLEAAANTRDDKLDADDDYDNIDESDEYVSAATTAVNDSYKKDITNITDADVTTFKHGSVDVAASIQNSTSKQPVESYDDLPF
jgi:hypothetical protein